MQTTFFRIPTEHKWTYTSPENQDNRWWRVSSLPNVSGFHYAVSDLQQATILLFDAEGYKRGDLSAPAEGWRPFSLTQGPGHTIGVTDWGNHCIQITSIFGDKPKKIGMASLDRPGDIVMTTVGNWAVTDLAKRSVVLLDPFGGMISEFQHQSRGSSTWFPEYLATDSKQRIAVSDYSSASVDLFDPRGGHISTLEGTVLSKPNGVAFDPYDNILVCDQGKHRIALFDPNGRYIKDIVNQSNLPSVRGPHAPDFWRPIAMTVNEKNGDLAVAAAFGQKFALQCFSYLEVEKNGHVF